MIQNFKFMSIRNNECYLIDIQVAAKYIYIITIINLNFTL